MSGAFSLSDFLAVERSLYGRAPRGLGRWDPRLKLVLAAAAILANALLVVPALSVALVALAWTGLLASRIPIRQALLFILAPAWATAIIVLAFGLGSGRTPLAVWGPLTFYREGLLQGFAAALRVLAEVSWVALLMLTTPFAGILAALRWARLPGVLVDLLAAIYRYIFLLFDELQVMLAAARARGGFSTRLGGVRTLGMVGAQIFMRALDRAERIEAAMRVRGRDAAAPDAQGAPHA